MDNKNFVFVILHYITFDDTVKCVESIFEKCDTKNFKIVIVDNASTNKTGDKLIEKYKENDKIHIIISKKNEGFARGNNIGFKYAKEQLNADFIIMINNDTYLIQRDFCYVINEEYNKSSFAILGPRIIMRNNKICEYPDKMPSLDDLIKKRFRLNNLYIFNKIHLRYIYSLITKILLLFYKKEEFVDTSIRKKDVVINGCCLIFSNKYIEKFDGIDDRTFLYYEEQLLYLRIKKNNLLSIYNPDLLIYHNEGSSTIEKTKRKRKRIKLDFIIRNELKSIEILISELKNN